MAITILLEPQEMQPVYNEIITVLDSTKKTEANFQYIVDVNIDGVFSSRLKIPSNPSGYGVVDLHKHIEPFISYDLDTTETDSFRRIPNSFKKYDITLYEEYVINAVGATISDNSGNTQIGYPSVPHQLQIGDKIIVSNSTVPAYDGVHTVTSIVSTTIVKTDFTYTSPATGDWIRQDGATTVSTSATVFTGDKFAFNGVSNWVDVPNFDSTDYILDVSLKSFLSTIPSVNEVRLEDRIYLNFYNNATNNANALLVTSENGVYHIVNPFAVVNDSNKFISVGVGGWNLINTTSTVNVISGSLPILDANSTSYTVQMFNDFGFTYPTSNEITFNINSDCNNFENYRLMYLDSLGSFQNVNFDLAADEDLRVNRKTYKKHAGSYNATAVSYGWASQDRGNTVIDTDIEELFTIRTNWIDNNIASQVKELIKSPEVYHINESGVIRAIDIKTNNLRVKNTLRNKVFNYEIKFQYSNKNTTQRG